MSASAKALFSLFFLLALISLGHDIYVWQNSDGFPFAFAALGWITKTYIPTDHQMVVDMLGAETFNQILTPILKIPAFFLTSTLAAFIYAVDFINRFVKDIRLGRHKNRNKKSKANQR